MQELDLYLRPLMDSEFESWKEESGRMYAQEMAVTAGLTSAEAKAESDASFARHLPNGLATENHYVYRVEHKQSKEVIGNLWWGTNKHGPRPEAWIFNIELLPKFRGKGYGRQTMLLAEADVKAKGFVRVGLHVFAFNKIALGLYETLGFRSKNIVMFKELESGK